MFMLHHKVSNPLGNKISIISQNALPSLDQHVLLKGSSHDREVYLYTDLVRGRCTMVMLARR